MEVRYDENVMFLRKKIIHLIMNSSDRFIPVNCTELYPFYGTEQMRVAIKSLIEDGIVKYRNSDGVALRIYIDGRKCFSC